MPRMAPQMYTVVIDVCGLVEMDRPIVHQFVQNLTDLFNSSPIPMRMSIVLEMIA